jgi:hypothetical protein
MKYLNKTLGAGLGLVALLGAAADLAASPMSHETGIVAVQANGNDGTAAALNYLGSPFVRAHLMEGTVEAVSATGSNTVVTVSGADFSDDQFNGSEVSAATNTLSALKANTDGHTLQLASGDMAGKNFEIIDTRNTNEIVVFGDQVANIQIGAEFLVIQDWTLNSLLGSRLAGAPGSGKELPVGWNGGTSAGQADVVYVVNRSGAFDTFFFSILTDEWVDQSRTPQGDLDVFSDINSGFVLIRQSGDSEDLTIAFSGEARVLRQMVTLPYAGGDSATGIYIMTNPFVQPIALDDFGLAIETNLVGEIETDVPDYDQVAGPKLASFMDNGTTAGQADQVYVQTGSGTNLLFVDQNGDWLDSARNPQGDFEIVPGQAIFFLRNQSDSVSEVPVSRPFRALTVSNN